MKQQKQTGKLEATSSLLGNLKTLFLTILGLIVLVAVIVAFINSQNNSDNSSMSTGEAQKKCVVITLVGYKKTGMEQSVDEAQRHCMAMWDSPEREKTFVEFVTKEWEANKDEVFEGKTVETIYEEMKESL